MGVSFKSDILPLFRPGDIACMADYGVMLDDYNYMSQPANAQAVYDHLTGKVEPTMPPDGKWSPDKLDLFNSWMTVQPAFQP